MASIGSILFFSGDTSLSINEWEQIVHSLITYGSTIWLHADSELSPNLPPEISVKLKITYNELIEAKKIKTWELEASKHRLPKLSSSSSRIISTKEHRSLYESINFTVLEKSEMLVESLSHKQEVERTSKLIDFRQELWNLGIATLCGSGAIVYQRISPRSPPYSSYYKYELLNKRYTQCLFKKFRLPGLYLLSARDIIELQKISSGLRSKIDSLILTRISGVGIPDELISEDCDKLFAEFLVSIEDMISEKTKKGTVSGITKDVVIGATGLVLPVVGALPIAEKLGNWFMNKGIHSFVLYMLELQKRVFKAKKR